MPNNKLQECAYPPCKNRFKPLAVGTSREKKYCDDVCKGRDRTRKQQEAREAKAEMLTCAMPGCDIEFRKKSNKRFCCREHEQLNNGRARRPLPGEDPLEAAKRQLQEKAERQEYTQRLKEAAEVGLVIDKLLEAVERAEPVKFKQLFVPKVKAKRPPEDAVLLMSDLQIGEYITLEESGGLAEYSYATFCKRLERLTEAVYSIVEIQAKSYSVPKLHVPMLGDMLGGEMVFIGQRNYIDLDLGDQFVEGADRVCEFLVNMASVFDQVEVDCVPGNHGRLGKKGEYKPHVNMDWFWYKYLEAKLQNYKNITWNIPKAWFIVKPVRGWCFLFQHGEDVRGWAGYPYYGLDRDSKSMRDMLQTIGQDFYYSCYGHWHEHEKKELVRGERLVNGSFVGGSIFSTKKLRKTGRPSQKFFGVSESKGLTWQYDLYLDID